MTGMTDQRESARAIVRTLTGSGFKAYLVGGCVRDMIMGRPCEDFDIATNALPDQIRSLFPRTIPVGEQFGVIIVLSGDAAFEVATFRKDHAYHDGRHPETVSFSDEREDALRRDFTINGLFYDPAQDRVIDYVQGRQDIRRRIIRTIGNPRERFQEDRLRLFRAIRFASQLGFAIEETTWDALKSLADGIRTVSSERIRDELVKTLTGGRPDRGLRLLDQSGLLKIILPEIAAMKGVEQPALFHPEGDVFEHTCIMLGLMENPGPELALAVLFHDVGKPPTFTVSDRIRFNGHDMVGARITKRIMARLKFPRRMTERVLEMVKSHMRFMHVREMRESTLKRFMNQETFPEQLELHRLDCMASHRDVSNWEFCREKHVSYQEEELRPPRILTGHDLIGLGYIPGPRFSEMLRFVEDAQLEGRIGTKEEAISLVLNNFPPDSDSGD